MINGVSTLCYSLEMDWVLLWLTGKFLGHRTTYLRLSLGAVVGILPTLWVLLCQNLYAVPWELGLVWPGVMLAVAFPLLSRRFWLKTYGLFLAMGFLAGGLVAAGLSWIHLWDQGLAVTDWLWLVPLLLVAVGLWAPKRRVRQLVGREALGEVKVELDGQGLVLPVLWDSGNTLREPSSGRPVVIVEMDKVLDWIPKEVLSWMLTISTPTAPRGVPDGWQKRLHIVTFRTIAGEGKMPVVEADRALGRYDDVWYPMVPIAIGISFGSVSTDNTYAALASPKSLIHYPNERVGA